MSERNSVNPFIEIPESILYPGEVMLPLNPAANAGYLINPVYFVTSFGRYFSIATGKLIEKQLATNNDGYYDIQVMTSVGQKHLLAHRGVLATFYPRPDMYNLQVDHINGDHYNNRIDNLRWVTCQQNVQYANANGIAPTRSRAISDSDIITIMELAYQGKSDKEIYQAVQNIMKVTESTIRFIRTGQMIYGEILQRLGIEPIRKRNHTFLTEEDYNKISELYEAGYTPNEIAVELNIGDRTVREHVLRTFGNKNERSDLNNLKRKEPKVTVARRADPFVKTSDKILNNNNDIRPVNPNTSNSHVINPWYYVSKDGRMFSAAKGNDLKEMTAYIDSKGYASVGLVTDHGTKQFRVHRIVLATFNPRPDMYELDIDHINAQKADNRLENLEWVTNAENMQRAAAIGITAQKTSQKAPDEDIIKIIELANKGYSDEDISKMLDNKYSAHNVRIIRTGDKTYGPTLQRLGLQPYKKQLHVKVTPEQKQAIKDYINNRHKNSVVGMMTLYQEASIKFRLPSETIRKIYSS